MQRVITRCQSITVLTNPTGTQAHTVLPTIHEEVTRSPLSPIYQSSPLSPVSPRAYGILKNPARALPLSTPLSSPSVRQSRSPLHIILSDSEREKREAHPLSLSSVRQSLSLSHITILSNSKKEKRAKLRSTQRTKSIRNPLAAALAPKHVPTVSITPISILKAPTTPQTLGLVTVAEPNPDAVKENVKVKFVLSDIVVQETGQGDYDPETGTGVGTTMMSSGEMLCVPLVDWRGRLDEDELSRYYPKVHANEQFVHGRSMVRSGSRSAATRRRDNARRRWQTTATASAATTPPSIALIANTSL